MASQLRVNKLENRSGLGTITYTDTGAIVSGIVTANSFSGDVIGNITGAVTATTGSFSGDVSISEKIIHTGDTNTFMKFDTDTVTFETAGSQRLRIDSTGKVGINRTTTLVGLLDVKGVNDDSIKFSASAYGGGHLRITGEDRTPSGTAGPYGHTIRIKTKTQNNNAGNGAERDALIFYHEGWSGLHVASFPNGKVGINEVSPDNKLHVTTTDSTSYSTNTNNTQNITNALLKLQNLDGGDSGGVNNYVGIHFAVANGATSHAQLNYVRTGDNSGKFSFKARNGNGSVYPNLMDITSAGYIKTPNQPIFMAYRVSNYDITTTATAMVYTEEKIDVGGNYDPSNGRFTAPVDGVYEFGYASIAKNTTTVYRYDLRINGSIPYSGMRQELRLDQSNNSSQYATNGEFCLYINMTAGQYAQVYVHADSAASAAYGDTQYGYTYFRGRLIG